MTKLVRKWLGICLLVTTELALTAAPGTAAVVRSWAARDAYTGAVLEMIRNPDGTVSADLRVRGFGCMGGLNGLVTETASTITITADELQKEPAGCAITLERRGRDLKEVSATRACLQMGGPGCDLYESTITLHRVRDVPENSSMAGYYFFIRHLPPEPGVKTPG
ncbi:hypothetical protein [Rhizosaccharibacter radicis]|uniref:Uncharacterized protein n=1 Tax=Rhizosaccharibacter radicis TaxID=2782605 RepID=A0ABT1VZ30_9PROT|nr:hypothetical protein [Acetobacteraceae bacterium KSS12]